MFALQFYHFRYTTCPLKNCNQTSTINSFQNLELIWICMLQDDETLIKLAAFYWKFHLIWFSGHKEIQIFVMYVISPFYPSFDRINSHYTQHNLHSYWMVYGDESTKLGWKGLMTYMYLTKSNFFITTEPNYGFFAKMQISFIILNHILINS